MEMHPDGSGPLLSLGAALDNLFKEQAEFFKQPRPLETADEPDPEAAGMLLLAAMMGAARAGLDSRQFIERGRAELVKVQQKMN